MRTAKFAAGPASGWRIQLAHDRGVPTPAVAHGRVLVGGGFGSHEFYAFDAESGALAWQLHTRDDGPTAAVVWDRWVVFNTESCTLEVVEVETGQVVAESWLGDPLLAQPAVSDGRAFMAFPAGGEHWLGAFQLPNLEPVWRTRISHDVITAPVCAEGKVWLATFDGAVWCVDERSGQVDWTRSMGATSAPWVHGGRVFVAHRVDAESRRQRRPAERTASLSGKKGRVAHAWAAKAAPYLDRDWGADRKAAYHAEDAAVGFAHAPAAAKLDVSAGVVGEYMVSRTWRFQGSRPVVARGLLFDATGDRIEARDLETDELAWSWHGDQSIPGERRLTPPAAANGRVWAGSWSGALRCWDALAGSEHWSIPLGAPCHWQPVAAGGWIFAGLEDGSLVGFTMGDRNDDGWPMWGGGPGHNGPGVDTPRPDARHDAPPAVTVASQ